MSNSTPASSDTAKLLVCDAEGTCRAARPDEVLDQARRILASKVRQGACLSSPTTVKDYLRLQLAETEHEIFAVLFLDAQQKAIAFEPIFRGTLTQTSVYPREVVKEALKRNAAAVILAHNHPSGAAEPSRADEYLTETLRKALDLVDVRVLDHFVVGMDEVVSFAERGLL